MRDDIERYWRHLAEIAIGMPIRSIERAADLLLTCRREGGTIFILGNGGSAATASHLACDLAKGTRARGRPSFRVMPLTDNVPLMTAWANDVAYDRIFAEQLDGMARPGDVVLIITASGNSPNVLAAARTARAAGARVIALTGRSGGKVRRLSSLTIAVPSDNIEQIEDAHLAIAHSLCVALRGRLRIEASECDALPPLTAKAR